MLADRGVGDQKLYRLLETLGWDYIIRFRAVIQVKAADGTSQRASAWLPASGRATMIPDARVTRTRAQVPAVVVVHAARMKEAWCLATSLKDQRPAEIVTLYGRRFTVEETFRDQKDLRFGLGLSATHIGSPDRRDRMLLLAAIAQICSRCSVPRARRAGSTACSRPTPRRSASSRFSIRACITTTRSRTCAKTASCCY